MGFHFFFGYFFGAAIGGLVWWLLGFRRRSNVEPAVWWTFLLAGFAVMMWAAFHSTMPSFARRVTAVSTVSSCVTIEHRRSIRFVIHLDQGPGGPTFLDTEIPGPMCRSSAPHSGNIYKIDYLDTPDLNGYKEVVAVSVIAGPDKGWHSELDARPFGLWLGIPLGAALGILGMTGLKFRMKDLKRCRIEDKRASRPARVASKL